MPNPRSGESREDFIGRCMADPEALADFPEADQRFAVCNTFYDDSKTKLEGVKTMDAIKEIQQAISEALSNGASKMELKSLEDRLMERVNNRVDQSADVDQLFSKFQTELEKTKAELSEQVKKSSYAQVERKESFGEFLVKARRGDSGLREMTRKALGESTGVDGGFLVPEQFMNEVAQIRLENSVVRGAGARIINMTSNILKMPSLNVASNAAGSIFGGVAAYWTGEGETKTPSAPKFKQVTLEANKLIGYVESSDELNNDAIVSMGGLLQDLFAQTIAFEEDAAFLSGNGVGKPLGILNAPVTIAETRTTASRVGTVDLVKMLARSYGSLSNKVWVINQSVLPEIYKLKDENSNYILLPGSNSNIAGALPQTIYGIPVVVSEKLPALGTSGDILLADMSYYLIGDRQQLTVDESIHVKFQTDEKSWRFVSRVAGQPWLDSAITPRNGGSTLSPFVKLT
jgi:HK97 family phage major capsid protein